MPARMRLVTSLVGFLLIGLPQADLRADEGPVDVRRADPAVAADTVVVSDTPHRLFQDEMFTLDLGLRVQVRYSHFFPNEGDAEGSFRIRVARLALAGHAYRHFDYRVQFELAGSAARLLDATLGHTFSPAATLTVGQSKAPFGRQQLISTTRLQFVGRSIVDGRFSAGRQVGALLSGFVGGDALEYGVGIYNGEGTNVTNTDGDFMQVGRLVWTPLGPYPLAESSLDYPESPRVALGVAGLNSTLAGESPTEDDDIGIRRLNLEAAFKLRGFNALGELYLEQRDPEQGDGTDTTGWHSQLAYLLPDRNHELAVRLASIAPDAPLAETNERERTEFAVGVSRYFEGHSAKLQTDLVRIRDDTLGTSDTELRVQLQVAF